MRDTIDNNFGVEEEEGGIDIKSIIFLLINNWYWFVVSVVIVMFAAVVYLRYTTPQYQVTSSVLFYDDKSSASIDLESLGLGLGGSSSNINSLNTEMVVMKSRTLIEEVVLDLKLNVVYKSLGRIRDAEMYNSSPIIVSMSEENMQKLGSSIMFSFSKSEDGSLNVKYEFLKEEFEQTIKSLPSTLDTPVGRIALSAPNFALFEEWEVGNVVEARIISPQAVAMQYKNATTLTSEKLVPNIVSISFVTTNRQRGVDFVNKLVEAYNKQTATAKNEMMVNTSDFIAERIKIIDAELSSTEKQIEEFKREVGTVSIEGEAQYTYSQNKAYEEMLVQNASQQQLLAFFKEHMLDSKNKNNALPINIGVEDGGLSELVSEYNTLLVERKRVAQVSSEKNPAMVNFDLTLESLFENIIVVINSVERNLKIQQSEIERESAKYDQRLNKAPAQEREFISIVRQQEIKSGLYLLLLQKREENAMMVASTTTAARVFEETVSLGGPISPNRRMIYMVALIFGLAVPACVIYLLELFKFKIETSSDVEKITNVPIVGVIPFIKSMPNADNSIVVEADKNDMMVEGFRDLRTNILYMLGAGQKVILVTSTHASEGKSYTSVNLAISMALMGKKVVVVGLDIRKPGLNMILGTSAKQKGVSAFLSGQVTDLMSLTQEVQPNLSVLYGGAVPPNPTELLSREKLPQALEILKENFDYIILDTAPVGVVADTYQFSKYVDLSVYVCRANVTTKGDYELINAVSKSEKLPNLCTSIVGVDTTKRRYGYGYGSRYGYGYGGKYGYGYGSYGYGEAGKSKK